MLSQPAATAMVVVPVPGIIVASSGLSLHSKSAGLRIEKAVGCVSAAPVSGFGHVGLETSSHPCPAQNGRGRQVTCVPC